MPPSPKQHHYIPSSEKIKNTSKNACRKLSHIWKEGKTIWGVPTLQKLRSPAPPTGCTPPSESLVHMLTMCIAYNDVRNRICEEYAILCSLSKSKISWQMIVSDNDTFCQFILDPASFNLEKRIHMDDPILGSVFELSRDYCYAINAARQNILGSLQKRKWYEFFKQWKKNDLNLNLEPNFNLQQPSIKYIWMIEM